MLYTKEQQENMRAEFEIAKAAGVNVSRVQWLSKDEVQSVSLPMRYEVYDADFLPQSDGDRPTLPF